MARFGKGRSEGRIGPEIRFGELMVQFDNFVLGWFDGGEVLEGGEGLVERGEERVHGFK